MIITITGKPCSGKGAVTAYLVEKYGFEKFSAGDIFRKIAAERGVDVLELNRINDTSIDHLLDSEVTRVGTENIGRKMIFDSRTAWHFVPESFKVFIDVQPEEQARRLLGSGRNTEKIDISMEEAISSLAERWELENKRYMAIYGFDNRDKANYDLVVDNTNLTIEETGKAIYEAYLKHIEK